MASYHTLDQDALSHIEYVCLNFSKTSLDTLVEGRRESSYKLMARKMWTVNFALALDNF